MNRVEWIIVHFFQVEVIKLQAHLKKLKPDQILPKSDLFVYLNPCLLVLQPFNSSSLEMVKTKKP